MQDELGEARDLIDSVIAIDRLYDDKEELVKVIRSRALYPLSYESTAPI